MSDYKQPPSDDSTSPFDTNTSDENLISPEAPELDDDELNEFPALPENCTFQDILPPGELLSAIEGLGFTTPTEVQRKAAPVALKGYDLIAQAQTGSGKTLAFVIPLLEKLREAEKQKPITQPFALVVVPTRELALQVKDVVNSLDSNIKPVCVIGGVDAQQQIKELRADCRIVVGTPGRILDFIKQRELRLHHCRFFVLDEVDEMLSIGFIEDVRAILSRLPDRRQGMFVSATITPRVEMMAHSFLNHPKTILIESAEENKPAIEHLYYEIGGDLMAKPSALCDLIETIRPRSAIIFCNTKSDTLLVEALLRRRGFDARRINSDLSQAQRGRVMKKIRAQELQFLVATDIAARGIDIEQIELVVNFAIHEQPETYVHRTGRTGRAGRRGKAVSLVGPKDFGAFHFLTKVLDVPFQKMTLPTDAEVADARLTHLYEMIRQKEIDVKERDVLVARQLLREMGGVTEPTEELEGILAKLCRYTVEHYVFQEAKALDEELDAPQKSSRGEGDREENSRRRDRKRRRDDDGHRDARDRNEGEGRDSRRGRGRDEENRRGGRDGERDRHERNRRQEHQRSHSDENAGEPDSQREGSSQQDTSRRGEPRAERREPAGDVRVYIGQGTSHGMTAELFTDLAGEVAEVTRQDISGISLREHYGFVDLPSSQASKLIANLNGIEYNGHALPVELAIVPTSRSRGPRRDHGEGGRERRHSDDGNRRNRRDGRNDRRRDQNRRNSRDSRGSRSRDSHSEY